MRGALIIATVPWEIGGAIWAGLAQHTIAAGVLTVVAVLTIMFIGDRYAKTENRIH